MRGEDYGRAFAAEFEHGVAEHLHVHGIEPGEGLIENHQLRPVQHGRDELHFLRHSFGERLDFLIGVVRQIQTFQPAIEIVLAIAAALEFGVEAQQLAHEHLAVQAALFGQVADAIGSSAAAGGILAQNLDAAAVGVQDAHNHAQRGGLARSVGPDESVNRPARNGQIQRVNRHLLPEGLGHANQFCGIRHSIEVHRKAYSLASLEYQHPAGLGPRSTALERCIAQHRHCSRAVPHSSIGAWLPRLRDWAPLDPALGVCYYEYCQFGLKTGVSAHWELCDALGRHHLCCSVTAAEHGGQAPSHRADCALNGPVCHRL